MIVEALIALVLIFTSTLVIYGLGKRSAPKTTIGENEQAAYACGEKVSFPSITINVSLYKYIVYFVVFDTSVLVLAFAALSGFVNSIVLILYVGIILAAGLVLFDGGKD